MTCNDEPARRNRYRVGFRKGRSIRFLSHHDLMRAFERALRRTAMPLAMTQGFNPHPRLALLWPTSVGMTAEEDFLECELSEPISPDVLQQRLSEQLPAGLESLSAERLASTRATAVESVEYEAEPPTGREFAPPQIEAALSRQHWPVARARSQTGATKSIDIRPYVLSLAEARGRIHMHLRVSTDGTARPAEVLQTLGYDPQELLLWKTNRRRVHLATASSSSA